MKGVRTCMVCAMSTHIGIYNTYLSVLKGWKVGLDDMVVSFFTSLTGFMDDVAVYQHYVITDTKLKHTPWPFDMCIVSIQRRRSVILENIRLGRKPVDNLVVSSMSLAT